MTRNLQRDPVQDWETRPEGRTSVRNEAAERLLDDPSILLMFSGPEIIGLNEGELALQLDAALAAERRATVQRIREAVNASEEADDMPRLYPKVLDILDEEAAR